MPNSYNIRLTITADTPFRNLAIDCVLEVLRAANIDADVQDNSEYETPEQERENNLASWFFLSFANDEQFLGGAFVHAHGPAPQSSAPEISASSSRAPR